LGNIHQYNFISVLKVLDFFVDKLTEYQA